MHLWPILSDYIRFNLENMTSWKWRDLSSESTASSIAHARGSRPDVPNDIMSILSGVCCFPYRFPPVLRRTLAMLVLVKERSFQATLYPR
jgi:hypothetical protein